LATGLGGRLGCVNFIVLVLVFWFHREGVRGPEEVGRQVREEPCEAGGLSVWCLEDV